LFNRRENDLTNYYNDEYYRDRMKDADSQSALAAVRDQLQEQSKKYANQFAASGATPEAKIAANTEANKTYAGTVNKLYGYGQQYKNQVRQNYLNGMNALYGQKINSADNSLNSTQSTWGNVAQGIGNAASAYTLADAYGSGTKSTLTPTMKGIIGQGGFKTGY